MERAHRLISHVVPVGPSFKTMPLASSSSRMRSLSAKFLAARAAFLAAIAISIEFLSTPAAAARIVALKSSESTLASAKSSSPAIPSQIIVAARSFAAVSGSLLRGDLALAANSSSAPNASTAFRSSDNNSKNPTLTVPFSGIPRLLGGPSQRISRDLAS
jgi:hypothetical protein